MNKCVIKVIGLLSLFVAYQGFADDKSISNQVNSNNTTEKKISIKWLGGPTMLISFNGFQIITDPMFGEGKEAFIMGDPNEMFDLSTGPNIKTHQRLTDIPSINLSNINLVVLSHAHEDHFDQVAEKKLRKSISLLLPSADENKVKDKGFTNISSLNWGDKQTYKAGNGEISFTAVTAYHSTDQSINPLLGKGNGYWIEFKEGNWQRNVYWTGDTLPTKDLMMQVRQLGTLDILIPHMGKVGTTGPLGKISMGVADTKIMAARLKPNYLLPIHHSTFSHYLEPVNRTSFQIKDTSYELNIISEGEVIKY